MPLRPYLLLDSRRRAQDDLPPDNIVGVVFQLDDTPNPAAAIDRVGAFAASLRATVDAGLAQAVLEAILDWLSITLPRTFPGPEAPAAVAASRQELLETEEGMTSLHHRAKEWEAEWIRQGIEQGIEQGIDRQRALLRRQAERRFGPATARELAGRLAAIADVEQFALVGDWIIDCRSGDALVALVEGAGGSAP